jgi:hypothetical protein
MQKQTIIMRGIMGEGKKGERAAMTNRLGKTKVVKLRADPVYNASGALVGWK